MHNLTFIEILLEMWFCKHKHLYLKNSRCYGCENWYSEHTFEVKKYVLCNSTKIVGITKERKLGLIIYANESNISETDNVTSEFDVPFKN